MEFLVEEKVFDLAISKACHLLESNSSSLLIYEAEANLLQADDYVYEKSFEEFRTKALEIIDTILKALEEFFKELKIKIDAKIQEIKLNKKLDELKELLAKKRAKLNGQKYDMISIEKYKSYYSKFIAEYTMELKKGLNKDFKSVKDYEKWRTDMLNKLSDFNYTMTDEEQWRLSVAINSAVELTEKEVINRDKNLKMVEEEGSRSIKQIEHYYKKIDNERSYVNYKGKLDIYTKKSSFIGFVIRKLSQAVKTVAHFITKHTFACVTAMLVAIIAL